MYKQCITQSARQRQRQLEEGLLQVMLHHDYEAISISELCEHLGIPRKSFYRYFSNKDGALYALIDHTLLDFAGGFFSPATIVNMGVGEEFFHYWLSKKDLLHALERNHLEGILVQRTIALTVDGSSYLTGLLPESIQHLQDYVKLFIISGIMSLLIQWEKDNFKATPREMAVMSAHILSPGVFLNRKTL